MSDDGNLSAPEAPDVSVVLICYNDEERLVEAIESARNQTLAAIEIIVVDHGSTDGSVAVARAAAQQDPRIRVVALPDNEGKPGRTINAGIDVARAPWVTVFASDDLLTRRACEHLLRAATKYEADIVVGGVRRLNAETGESTRWANEVTRRSRVVTDIRQLPELIRDTTGGGKLYNRAFMAEHGLRFPEDIFYQDQVLTIEYFATARTVAIVSNYVLDWRLWPSGDRPSVTQRRFTVENLADRFTANELIDDYLRRIGRHDLLAVKQRKFVTHDLKIHVKELSTASQEYQDLLAARTRRYTGGFEPEALVGVPLTKRLILNCLVAGRLQDAEQVSQRNFGRVACDWARVSHEGRSYVVPPWTTQATQSPDPAFDVTDYRLAEIPVRFRSVRADVTLTARRTGYAFDVAVRSFGRTHPGGKAELFFLQPDSGERFGLVMGEVFSGVRAGYRVHTSRRTLDRGLGLAPLPCELWFAWNRGRADEWWVRLSAAQPVEDGEVATGTTAPWFTTTTGSAVVLERRPDESVRDRVATRMGRRPDTPDPNEVLTLGQSRSYLQKTALEPSDDVVFFESFDSRRVAGGPLAVSRLLHERRPKLQQFWGCTSWSLVDVPEYATPVPRHSRRYLRALASARTWFDNGWLPFAPAETRRLVQLWHGSPVTASGSDLIQREEQRGVELDRALTVVRDAAAGWTHLVSSGPHFDKYLGQAFGSPAQLLHVGSPGVDPLFSDAAQSRRQELRRSWGLDDKRVVFFCPSLRVGEVSAQYRVPDLRALAELLGPDYYWLHREHDDDVVGRRMVWTPEDVRWFASVVSGHQDMTDYLLMADVLVSDYSTLIADIGQIGRPVVHFAPDREYFETEFPTTYVRLGESAAGPVVADDAALAAAIQQAVSAPGDRSRHWASALAPLDRGRSAEALLGELGLI